MNMISVFKTDVRSEEGAKEVIHDLLQIYPFLEITFDLEDEDNIMRVEGIFFKTADVISCLKENGYCGVFLPMDFGVL
ncbi:hypothetical protein ACTJJ0_32070 [Chitinophaga sp. 22321]|uniref:Uncharacterized protein n=1 Tax=Chitinophaga hostae TaxID=2831022 RepID=A0ABS5IXN7_9BACT|nr:hypothetical protein [Chitinophaga hostae]MBS0027645.1 hypothetical protein [Chitinophaga hostae]